MGMEAICIAAWLSQKSRAVEEDWKPKSRKSCWIQTTSLVAAAMALYLASAEDWEMVDCFLAFQDTRESPRKTQKPVTECLVSRQAPQSASKKALSWRDEVAEKKRPWPGWAFK